MTPRWHIAWPRTSRARLIERYDDEIAYLRTRLAETQERVDRLTESLAHKSDIPLMLPRGIAPPLEPASGWWDNKQVVKPKSENRNA